MESPVRAASSPMRIRLATGPFAALPSSAASLSVEALATQPLFGTEGPGHARREESFGVRRGGPVAPAAGRHPSRRRGAPVPLPPRRISPVAGA
jgi:hypothetical protein